MVTETSRGYSLQHSPIRESGPGRLKRTGSEDEALYFWIYPNLMLNVYPDSQGRVGTIAALQQNLRSARLPRRPASNWRGATATTSGVGRPDGMSTPSCIRG